MKNMRESEEQITVVKKRKSIERERKERIVIMMGLVNDDEVIDSPSK